VLQLKQKSAARKSGKKVPVAVPAARDEDMGGDSADEVSHDIVRIAMG